MELDAKFLQLPLPRSGKKINLKIPGSGS